VRGDGSVASSSTPLGTKKTRARELPVLAHSDLETLADLIADRLARQPLLTAALVDVATVARFLGVEPSFVYEHAAELGVVRLGSGPRARLRFDVEEALARLASCAVIRKSEPPPERVVERKPRRRRAAGLGTNVELLPIRGARPAA
jgi:hypothetical protein